MNKALIIKYGDTARTLRKTLRYSDGTVVNLTAASAVRLKLSHIETPDVVALDVATTIVLPLTAGIVDVKLTAANFTTLGATGGMFRAQWVITFANAEQLTGPTIETDLVSVEPVLGS